MRVEASLDKQSEFYSLRRTLSIGCIASASLPRQSIGHPSQDSEGKKRPESEDSGLYSVCPSGTARPRHQLTKD